MELVTRSCQRQLINKHTLHYLPISFSMYQQRVCQSSRKFRFLSWKIWSWFWAISVCQMEVQIPIWMSLLLPISAYMVISGNTCKHRKCLLACTSVEFVDNNILIITIASRQIEDIYQTILIHPSSFSMDASLACEEYIVPANRLACYFVNKNFMCWYPQINYLVSWWQWHCGVQWPLLLTWFNFNHSMDK